MKVEQEHKILRAEYKINITILMNWLNIYTNLKDDIKINLTAQAITKTTEKYYNKLEQIGITIQQEKDYVEKTIKNYNQEWEQKNAKTSEND